jgi:ribosome-associated heat shock protein Hsp15
MAEDALRVDLWLWRARFCKTRAQATAKAAEGELRLIRNGAISRIDKPSRTIRVGDSLTFVIASRVFTVRIVALGARRGPPAEARALYAPPEELAAQAAPLTIGAGD